MSSLRLMWIASFSAFHEETITSGIGQWKQNNFKEKAKFQGIHHHHILCGGVILFEFWSELGNIYWVVFIIR